MTIMHLTTCLLSYIGTQEIYDHFEFLQVNIYIAHMMTKSGQLPYMCCSCICSYLSERIPNYYVTWINYCHIESWNGASCSIDNAMFHPFNLTPH